jgi:hypothetical protein
MTKIHNYLTRVECHYKYLGYLTSWINKHEEIRLKIVNDLGEKGFISFNIEPIDCEKPEESTYVEIRIRIQFEILDEEPYQIFVRQIESDFPSFELLNPNAGIVH